MAPNSSSSGVVSCDPEHALSSFASLLSSALVSGSAQQPFEESSKAMESFLSCSGGELSNNNDADSTTRCVCSLPGLSPQSDSVSTAAVAANIAGLSLEEAAALKLAIPLSFTRKTLPVASWTVLGNISASFTSLVDSRLRSSVKALMRQAVKSTAIKNDFQRNQSKFLLNLLSSSSANPISTTTVVTTFRVPSDDDNNPSQQRRTMFTSTTGENRISLPLLFETVLDLSVVGSLVTVPLQAPGTINATLAEDDGNRLNAVEIAIDTLALLRVMMKQARFVVKKAVALANGAAATLAKITVCGSWGGSHASEEDDDNVRDEEGEQQEDETLHSSAMMRTTTKQGGDNSSSCQAGAFSGSNAMMMPPPPPRRPLHKSCKSMGDLTVDSLPQRSSPSRGHHHVSSASNLTGLLRPPSIGKGLNHRRRRSSGSSGRVSFQMPSGSSASGAGAGDKREEGGGGRNATWGETPPTSSSPSHQQPGHSSISGGLTMLHNNNTLAPNHTFSDALSRNTALATCGTKRGRDTENPFERIDAQQQRMGVVNGFVAPGAGSGGGGNNNTTSQLIDWNTIPAVNRQIGHHLPHKKRKISGSSSCPDNLGLVGDRSIGTGGGGGGGRMIEETCEKSKQSTTAAASPTASPLLCMGP